MSSSMTMIPKLCLLTAIFLLSADYPNCAATKNGGNGQPLDLGGDFKNRDDEWVRSIYYLADDLLLYMNAFRGNSAGGRDKESKKASETSEELHDHLGLALPAVKHAAAELHKAATNAPLPPDVLGDLQETSKQWPEKANSLIQDIHKLVVGHIVPNYIQLRNDSSKKSQFDGAIHNIFNPPGKKAASDGMAEHHLANARWALQRLVNEQFARMEPVIKLQQQTPFEGDYSALLQWKKRLIEFVSELEVKFGLGDVRNCEMVGKIILGDVMIGVPLYDQLDKKYEPIAGHHFVRPFDTHKVVAGEKQRLAKINSEHLKLVKEFADKYREPLARMVFPSGVFTGSNPDDLRKLYSEMLDLIHSRIIPAMEEVEKILGQKEPEAPGQAKASE